MRNHKDFSKNKSSKTETDIQFVVWHGVKSLKDRRSDSFTSEKQAVAFHNQNLKENVHSDIFKEVVETKTQITKLN